MPRAVTREARKLAATVTFAVGRREAVARHILALAVCGAGWMSLVARIPLFKAPGLLLADPVRESFYWSLDPGVPGEFEARAVELLVPLLLARHRPRGGNRARPDGGEGGEGALTEARPA